MNKNNWLKTLMGFIFAALFAVEAQAVPDLTQASFFVKLKHKQTVAPAGGGGVSRFEVEAYADGAGTSGELFGILGSSVFATCIEEHEGRESRSWYAVYLGLEGAPSATGGINFEEQNTIARVLGAEFGDNFQNTANSDYDSANVTALQAMLWEAGESTANDLTDSNGVSEGLGSAANTLADTWVSNYTSGDIPGLTLYSLINVDRSNGDFSVDDNGQDFLTYLPGGGPGIPLPAPILLLGLGLLGLNHFGRKRT